MDELATAKNVIINPATLPIRTGKRPLTIRGPLHVQCGDYGDDRAVHCLVKQGLEWPDIEASPLPGGSADLNSLRIPEDVATDESFVFLTWREFGIHWSI